MTARRGVGLTSRAAIGLGLFAAVTLVPGRSHADVASRPFQGSAESSGANTTVVIPGFPVSSTPVDSGGPVAQATLSSAGLSQGFASFPDPGSAVTALPGLGAGLFSGGFAGLPPINGPQPPSYPFEISTDAGTNPHQSAGAGPYSLAADSTASSSQVSATGGLQTGLIGNAALVNSTAGVSVQRDGSVLARAVSDVQSLTIGPLTIGEMKSTATETLGADGTIKPTTAMVLDGVVIGGLPVSISPEGLDVPGRTVPLPLNSTFASLLSASKISVTVVAAQSYPGRVVAPALQITGPVSAPIVGSAPGTYTLMVGGASAGMMNSVGADTSSAPSSSGPLGGSPVRPPAASTDSGTVPPSAAAGVGGAPVPAASVEPAPAVADLSPPRGPAAMTLGPRALRPRAVRENFDITSLYLIVAALAFVMWAAGQLVRLLGVRQTWT